LFLIIRYSVSLLFSCLGVHRDLHSFPTRRSSDLIDLRDASGVSQVVFRSAGVLEQAHRLRAEYCVRITGKVDIRPEGNQNFEIPDRKSTRLNSSHVKISYAVFCLKKKKTILVYDR